MDTPNSTELSPFAPDTPITRANLAAALLEVIASLPQEITYSSQPSLCVNGSSIGGPLTYIPAAPKDAADHA